MQIAPIRAKPAAERWASDEQREDAALRPGAAAGCRSRSDRICRQSLPQKLRMQAAGRFATDFAGGRFHHNRQLWVRISAIMLLLNRRPLCMESIAKRSAGRSLGAAEARSSYPNMRPL